MKKLIFTMVVAAGLIACGGGEKIESTESKPISNATQEEAAPNRDNSRAACVSWPPRPSPIRCRRYSLFLLYLYKSTNTICTAKVQILTLQAVQRRLRGSSDCTSLPRRYKLSIAISLTASGPSTSTKATCRCCSVDCQRCK